MATHKQGLVSSYCAAVKLRVLSPACSLSKTVAAKLCGLQCINSQLETVCSYDNKQVIRGCKVNFVEGNHICNVLLWYRVVHYIKQVAMFIHTH